MHEACFLPVLSERPLRGRRLLAGIGGDRGVGHLREVESGNWDYPDASYSRRREIVQEHINYQKGLLYFIANNPRMPADVRSAFSKWGLPKDEFRDNGNWPHQMYVRETGRMIGRHVMTENEFTKKRPTLEPAGMGSYGIDSHNIQRYIPPEGYVQNGGDIRVSTNGPYGTIRTEPVFMILGQSAATAASMTIDSRIAVQDVPYDKMRTRLLADGQVLEYATPARGH